MGDVASHNHCIAVTDLFLLLPNEELKPPALALKAAGSLRSPAALLLVGRGLTPAR